MTFGEKLFKLRKEKGLSQEQLAEQMNTTRQAVSKWENDQGFPEMEKLMMLGNIFSVSIDYLLKNSGEADGPAAGGLLVPAHRRLLSLLQPAHPAGLPPGRSAAGTVPAGAEVETVMPTGGSGRGQHRLRGAV